MARAAPWVCAVAAAAWLAGMLAAPVWLAAPSGPRPVAFAIAAAYQAGSYLCHQDPARSFAAAGMPLPVCARCTGLYAGAVIGAVAALATRRRSVIGTFAGVRAVLVLAAFPTAVLWLAEWAAGVIVGNATRCVGAVPLGAAVAWLLSRLAGGGRLTDTPEPTGVH